MLAERLLSVFATPYSRRTPGGPGMPRAPYSQPIYLDDIFLVDILELRGSQHAASAFLAISQSAISRALSRFRSELDLDSASGSAPICRIGRNACFGLLRMASRAR